MRSRAATLVLTVLVLCLCASAVEAKKNRIRRGIATTTHKYMFNSYRSDYQVKRGAILILNTETFDLKALVKGAFSYRFVRTDGTVARRVKARMNCLAADGTPVLDLETPTTGRTDILYNHGEVVSGYDLFFPVIPQTAIPKGATCVHSLEVDRGSLTKGDYEFQLFLKGS